MLALEALRRHIAPVLVAHQIVVQQNAMDRAVAQLDPLPLQHNPQLTCSPVGITLPQFDHLLNQFRRCLARTPQGPSAALHDAF